MPNDQLHCNWLIKWHGGLLIGAFASLALHGQCASAKTVNPPPPAASPKTSTAMPVKSKSDEKTMRTPLQNEFDGLLQELISWRSLDKQQLLERLQAKPEQIETLHYQRLQNLTAIRNPARHPATFLFQGEKLVLITLSDPSTLERFSISDMRSVLKGEPGRLSSRFGKVSAVYVYPEVGLAFTSRRHESNKIQYIEIFPPQTLESYKSTIYEDPTSMLPH